MGMEQRPNAQNAPSGMQKALSGGKPPRKGAETKSLDGKQRDNSMKMVWILEDGKPKRAMVKVLVGDNQNTAVESKMLNENSKIIISQSSENE